MSCSEIETVMCNPLRFWRILHGAISDYNVEHSTASLSDSLGALDTTDGAELATRDVVSPLFSKLLPGGRFLISISNLRASTIRCWDLHCTRSLDRSGPNEPIAEWTAKLGPNDRETRPISLLQIHQTQNDPDSFIVAFIVLGPNRSRHMMVLRLTLSSANYTYSSLSPGFTLLQSTKLNEPSMLMPLCLNDKFIVFHGTHATIAIWNWVENTWGALRTTKTWFFGEPKNNSQPFIVGPNTLGVLKTAYPYAEDRPAELLFMAFPEFTPIQEEAVRRENVHYLLLHHVEIFGGRAFVIKSASTTNLPRNVDVPVVQPILLHMMRSVSHNHRDPYRSACLKLSIPNPGSMADSGSSNATALSAGGSPLSRRDLPSTANHSPTPTPNTNPPSDSIPRIVGEQVRFAHPTGLIVPHTGLHVSPFGDVVQLSVGIILSDAESNRLIVETVRPIDFIPTSNPQPDRVSVSIEAGTGTTELDGVVGSRAQRIVDLGPVSYLRLTYIDWWNGAIVQQVGNSHLLIRKVHCRI
ncbi:hypothetical protein DL93DRAFT_2167605 [Clavulina sp. PMI_390]|nr:hypothetical protein DL93DRAFT_2167605 [Clavulina sp. PMI_390]